MLCSVLLFYIQYRTFIRESEEEDRNIFIVMFVPERSERNGKNDGKDFTMRQSAKFQFHAMIGGNHEADIE